MGQLKPCHLGVCVVEEKQKDQDPGAGALEKYADS